MLKITLIDIRHIILTEPKINFLVFFTYDFRMSVVEIECDAHIIIAGHSETVRIQFVPPCAQTREHNAGR